MVETKPFKTKLCVLYERGRCGRQTCTFAHGDAELRRYPASIIGQDCWWRNNKGNDLRNKLDRRRSPLHRYSPGRDARGWHSLQRFSPPRQINRRKYRRLENVDGQSDVSGSFKVSDGTQDRGKDKKLASSHSNMLEDKLKQVQYEVDVLLDQRSQLEIELEERVQEADGLSSKVKDLEAELSDERDKSKRINSKIKKLIREYGRHIQLQDELKRSQVQLEKLVEELGLNATQVGASEDNSNINIISEEEPDLEKDYTLKKHLHNNMETSEAKLANTGKGYGVRVERSSRWKSHLHSNDNKDAEVGNKRKDTARLPSNESKPKRQRDASKISASSDILKISESNVAVPPTSMAAHAVDDYIELNETEERTEAVENELPFPLPPLPTVSQNNYFQYEGGDDNVDVDGLEEDVEEVDIV